MKKKTPFTPARAHRGGPRKLAPSPYVAPVIDHDPGDAIDDATLTPEAKAAMIAPLAKEIAQFAEPVDPAVERLYQQIEETRVSRGESATSADKRTPETWLALVDSAVVDIKIAVEYSQDAETDYRRQLIRLLAVGAEAVLSIDRARAKREAA